MSMGKHSRKQRKTIFQHQQWISSRYAKALSLPICTVFPCACEDVLYWSVDFRATKRDSQPACKLACLPSALATRSRSHASVHALPSRCFVQVSQIYWRAERTDRRLCYFSYIYSSTCMYLYTWTFPAWLCVTLCFPPPFKVFVVVAVVVVVVMMYLPMFCPLALFSGSFLCLLLLHFPRLLSSSAPLVRLNSNLRTDRRKARS